MDRRALNDTQTNGPPAAATLTPMALHVLIALGDGPLHGYALMQQVVARGVRDVALAPGTLYRVLDRLRTDSLIAEIDRAEIDGCPVRGGGDTRRRYYRLTDHGRHAALGEKHRCVALIAAMDATALLRGRCAADTAQPAPQHQAPRQEETRCADD
jgi:hypothetical protein